MADYLVTDTELESVADAIRTKGGTSAALTWPTGYVDAIDDISSGGGVATRSVSVTDSTACFYPDENMNPVSASGTFSAQMPIGAIVFIYFSGPAAYPPSGLSQLASYSRGKYTVYKVDPA